MTHEGNCLHVATLWFNSLWPPGSVTWRKKQLDIPVLTFWCFGPGWIKVTSAHNSLTSSVHMDPLYNPLCALLIKRIGKCGEAKACLVNLILLDTYKSQMPYLPVLQPHFILISFLFIMFQPHYSFWYLWSIPSFFLY